MSVERERQAFRTVAVVSSLLMGERTALSIVLVAILCVLGSSLES